ncbi:hypothetical protein [Nibribacter koreensis]|uniref:hypothetical protein n=1 Tax=Nibribacter koreensis TaxID=1084519 RepID=UPI0031E8EB63
MAVGICLWTKPCGPVGLMLLQTGKILRRIGELRRNHWLTQAIALSFYQGHVKEEAVFSLLSEKQAKNGF